MSCVYCTNAYTDDELDHDHDLSMISIGESEKGLNMFFNTGDNRPTNIDVLQWSDKYKQNLTVCLYVPKYCPECGRRLFENDKYFEKKKI